MLFRMEKSIIFQPQNTNDLMKKFFKYTGIVLLILVVLAFLIPVLFKNKILTLVKTEINKNIEATVALHRARKYFCYWEK